MLATTPSGSCAMRSRHAAVAEHRLGRRVAVSTSPGRSRCAPSRPLSSLRDCLIGLPVSASGSRPAARRSAATRIAKARDAVDALVQRRAGPRRLRGARRARLGGDRLPASSAGSSAIVRAGGRVADRSAVVMRLAACGRARQRQEVVEERGVVDSVRFAGSMELGVPLHGGHVPGAPVARGSPRSCRRRAMRFDHEAGRQVLDAPGGGCC